VAFGWRGTLLTAGAVALLLAALIWLVVRDKPADGSPDHLEHPHDSILGGLKAALREPQTWVLSGIGMMQAAPLLAFAGLWAVPYAMTAWGLERPAAAGMASLVLLGWAAGGPIQGWLSDRMGRRRLPIVVAGGVALVTILAIVYVPGLPLWLAQILFVANGFACALMPVVFASTREANPRAVGPALAIVNMATVSSGALFQPLVGWMLDRAWDGTLVAGARVYSVDAFRYAFLSLAAAAFLGFALAFWVRERRPGV
ncbi:MAG: MFS transporter, partial [Pseudomonadota bacterium]